jgi:hypothetical protein
MAIKIIMVPTTLYSIIIIIYIILYEVLRSIIITSKYYFPTKEETGNASSPSRKGRGRRGR